MPLDFNLLGSTCKQKRERKVWEGYFSFFKKYPEVGKRGVRGIFFFNFEYLDIQKREREV